MAGVRRGAMAALCVVVMAAASPAAGERGRDDHVLLLNSYHPQYAWTDALVRGALGELGGVLSEENIHVEYMDLRRMIDDATYLDHMAVLLADKYRGRVPAAILVSDDGATRFLLQRRHALFPGVPIVFCGINSIPQEELEGVAGITGIMEGLEIEQNLRLIEQLHPDVRRIVLLADRTSLGRGMTDAYRALPAGIVDAPVEVWDDFNLAELRARMAAAGRDTAFLLLAIHRDRDGRYFSFARDLPPLADASRAPVYAMFGMLIGTGVVGGFMNDPYEHGRATAAVLRRVLAGVPVDAIPVADKAEYAPRFDWRALQRFDIDEASLPPGSQVVGRPFSIYESYRAAIWTTAAIMAALLIVISGLLYLIVRMRRAEGALVASHQALQRAQRAQLIGQLSGGIAHDFNNLLMPIQAGTHLLRRRVSGDALEDVELIEAAARRARELVQQLLALGRDVPLSPRRIDLGVMLPPVIALLQKSGAAAQLSLAPGASLVAEIDRAQIERVVMNLVMNARDAGAGSTTVHIAVSAAPFELRGGGIADLADGRYIRLRVEDDGVGMDRATLERIFEPFFTTKERGRGAGLGLSTVQAIVRQHGGAITVESTPGRGTRFDVYLPASDGPADAEPAEAPADPATLAASSRSQYDHGRR